VLRGGEFSAAYKKTVLPGIQSGTVPKGDFKGHNGSEDLGGKIKKKRNLYYFITLFKTKIN